VCRSCVYRVQHSHCVEQASQDIGRPREEVCLTPKADVECLQWIRPVYRVSIVCLSCVLHQRQMLNAYNGYVHLSSSAVCLSCVYRVSVVCLSCVCRVEGTC
jgi:hypothetical protein